MKLFRSRPRYIRNDRMIARIGRREREKTETSHLSQSLEHYISKKESRDIGVRVKD